MSTVYVVQEPKPGPQGYTYDISPAMQHGSIVFVFQGHEQPGVTPGPSMFKAKQIFKEFSDDDFLLWAGGDPAALAIATMAAADANRGHINFLRWERERDPQGSRTKRGYYMPVRISLRGQL